MTKFNELQLQLKLQLQVEGLLQLSQPVLVRRLKSDF